jgi:WD40 repeat protein
VAYKAVPIPIPPPRRHGPGLCCAVGGQLPEPDTILADVKHTEPKSGVQLGPRNTLTIQSGVGTPTTINVLAFSKDSKLLAAGKDFGRVVVWDLPSRKVLCAVDTGQGIVHAVALSADGQLMATGGDGDRLSLKLWHLPDGKLVRTYNYSMDTYVQWLSVQPVLGLLPRTMLP